MGFCQNVENVVFYLAKNTHTLTQPEYEQTPQMCTHIHIKCIQTDRHYNLLSVSYCVIWIFHLKLRRSLARSLACVRANLFKDIPYKCYVVRCDVVSGMAWCLVCACLMIYMVKSADVKWVKQTHIMILLKGHAHTHTYTLRKKDEARKKCASNKTESFFFSRS